jgi:ubiquinone/menaquinone biosynthesis C-methylase UbiE
MLPLRPPCPCGFVLRESDGIINLLTSGDAAAVQPFLDAYERIRAKEQWGGDDLDLPFHPKRHHEIWNIRQRTFRAFDSIATKLPRGLSVDVGAGNCWMTRYLDQWGFDAIAVDINISEVDGLRAGQKFIDAGAVFLRIRAGMERLPFRSGRIRLLAANASFHYARDFHAVLSEFERVLAPGGTIAIIDTPFYDNSDDGDRMMAERVVEFRQKYGLAEMFARKSSYMTYETLQQLTRLFPFTVRVHKVFPGFARKYQEVRARLAKRPIAEFPLVVLKKHE